MDTTSRLGRHLPIPQHEKDTGYLPPGSHSATLPEVRKRFGTGRKRSGLMAELEAVVAELWAHAVADVWIGGSFVTDKRRPDDVDVIYEPPPGAETASWGQLAPQRHDELKVARNIDLWKMPSPQRGKPGGLLPQISIKDFFSSDANGDPKGLIHLLVEETGDDQ